MSARWTVYGRRLNVNRTNDLGVSVYVPLHKEGFTSLGDATLWLMDEVLKHGASEMDVVIVHLMNGVDVNGEREVVRRIGNGRAWWE